MNLNLFETVITEDQAGFRLQRFEVLNWGTFNDHVWKIDINGSNALLTGDIGSGKSTLVDAITTLLVPANRVTFNKAAGAESKERTLPSYIRGEYKNEKDSESRAAKPVALRDKGTHTVILGHFHNEGISQGLTLAQVMWLKDSSRQVERFFVLSDHPLTIAEHFTQFGGHLLELKKRLRKTPGVDVIESFKEYGMKFRAVFGIEQEQALELFSQTISMKAVGNLTEFVRVHMLEESDVGTIIEDLKNNFENLSRSHDAVLKAKRQIELLKPICEEGTQLVGLSTELAHLHAVRSSVPAFIALQKVDVIEASLEDVQQELEGIEQRLAMIAEDLVKIANEESNLKDSLRMNGGGRIEAIKNEISQIEIKIPSLERNLREFSGYLESLGLDLPTSPETFQKVRAVTSNIAIEVQEQIAEIQNEQVETLVNFRSAMEECNRIKLELNSLKNNPSNIPHVNTVIRRQIAKALNLSESDLPFAGELMMVDPKQISWEGAIERLLRSFALSLVVSERFYAKVASYVDSTNLRGRLVYFRARPVADDRRGHSSRELCQNSVVKKIFLKHDSPHSAWLEQQLSDRFNYECADTIDDFKRHSSAITKQGQIKTGSQRHEKDDRFAIDRRESYVLGWHNEQKVAVLEKSLDTAADQAAELGRAIESQKRNLEAANGKQAVSAKVMGIESFSSIDLRSVQNRKKELEKEWRELESSSEKLKALQRKLEKVEEKKQKLEEDRKHYQIENGSKANQKSHLETALADAQTDSVGLPIERREKEFPVLSIVYERLLAEKFKNTLTLLNSAKVEEAVREEVNVNIATKQKAAKQLNESVIGKMKDFVRDYPAETKDFDAKTESLSDFELMKTRVEKDDLPRHEEAFRKLLNEGAINGIALFSNRLSKDAKEIQNKITRINKSLKDIEYNTGTFIELVCEYSTDAEVREFQQDLRACTEQTAGDSETYAEEKFLMVKAIISRFQGRKDFAEQDRKWIAKVTDVRQWHVFSASERYIETDEEKEFYPDSSGKSGGQKEKLAYTVLASALAYQFGLEWNAKASRTFRFVVIDEAFGRGSDESARYGLELFKKLKLQLLVVTPLQKIHIIEDYVKSVHLVHNEAGMKSKINSLTIEAFRAGKHKPTSV